MQEAPTGVIARHAAGRALRVGVRAMGLWVLADETDRFDGRHVSPAAIAADMGAGDRCLTVGSFSKSTPWPA